MAGNEKLTAYFQSTTFLFAIQEYTDSKLHRTTVLPLALYRSETWFPLLREQTAEEDIWAKGGEGNRGLQEMAEC